MLTEMCDEQIASYREDGFTVMRGFLNANEIAELKQAILDAIATMGKSRIAGPGANLVEGDAYFDRVYTQRLNLWRIVPTPWTHLHSYHMSVTPPTRKSLSRPVRAHRSGGSPDQHTCIPVAHGRAP